MDTATPLKKKRGRPPKQFSGKLETRALLVRKGMDLLTEKGFISTGSCWRAQTFPRDPSIIISKAKTNLVWKFWILTADILTICWMVIC